MAKLFSRIGAVRPGRSVFNLSYEKKFTCDMGQLIPIMCDEVVPGDTFKIGNEIVLRFQPLVAPILHEVNIFVHYFFVAYRLLWDDWENYITGGVDGEFAVDPPKWIPQNVPMETAIGTLWDYMGFPIGVDPVGAYPLDFPKRAYNFIFNEYYRDQTLDEEIPLDQNPIYPYWRRWQKDYFTSALPWQQRGTAPAFPISGYTNAEFLGLINASATTGSGGASFRNDPDGIRLHHGLVGAGSPTPDNIRAWFNNNRVDLSSATTFDVADLRLAFQIQRWLERNARSGARYTEFLRAHFAVSPRDERLDRPEYIGGSRSPLIISEVLQTSQTTQGSDGSPQGNLAGHGIAVDRKYISSYKVKEFGLIMGIMSIMPRPAYQQGINRQWLRRTKYDFYFPEFANLSEQGIENAEIVATNSEEHNLGLFGYQGRYNEMRYKENMVCGQMRGNLDYWHLGRKFSLTDPPKLNTEFIEASDIRKDVFEVQNEHTCIVSFGNLIRAVRPMPIMSQPGLIDH